MSLFLPQFNLQKYNTLAVPAIANWYVNLASDEALIQALVQARALNQPIMVLGGGSNIVLRENFPGVVMHLCSKGKRVLEETHDFVVLEVEAGESWSELVEYTLGQGFYGLENLSLIPGTVGAAPIQNIGAYGVELKDVFTELKAINIASGLPVTFTADSCQFGYRDSVFKQKLKDQYIITRVCFKLTKNPQVNLTYPALQQYFKDADVTTLSPLQVSEAVISIRQSKLPDPKVIPNAGSFFKNPIVSLASCQQLRTSFPAMVAYPIDEHWVKLAAGWLIDNAGWRGREFAGARMHSEQALVLTNPNKLAGDHLLALAQEVVQSVQQKFGVTLEMEPRIYPE